MRGHTFGWKAIWDSNRDWSCIRYYSGRRSDTSVKSSSLGRVQAVARLCVLHPGICFSTEQKSKEENVSHGSRKGPEGHDSVSTWPHLTGCQAKSVDPGLPLYNLEDLGRTPGQRRYLPSCVTKGFPTSANFESNLSVRDLTWSVKNGTYKSS
jgi:hypothetical protein